MKKLYLLLFLLTIVFTTNAQIINFPDANFKARLLVADVAWPNNWALNLSGQYFKIDANNNGEIEQSEAEQVGELNLNNSEILSVEGLQYFVNVKVLQFSYVHITALDVSVLPNLRELMCTNNDALTSLNLTGLTHLEKIWCSDSQLTTLDLSTLTALTEISCTRSHLTSINTTGINNLRVLVCGDNLITNLNVDNLTQLTHLYCEQNLLTSLDVSSLSNLQALNCNDNQLTSVDVSNLDSLESLSCQNNQLTSLSLNNSSTSFHYIYCYGNQLTSLNLNDFPELLNAYCQDNLITSLEINNSPYLGNLNCAHNQLTTLDLSNCTLSLQILECQNNNLNTLFIKKQ